MFIFYKDLYIYNFINLFYQLGDGLLFLIFWFRKLLGFRFLEVEFVNVCEIIFGKLGYFFIMERRDSNVRFCIKYLNELGFFIFKVFLIWWFLNEMNYFVDFVALSRDIIKIIIKIFDRIKNYLFRSKENKVN